MTEGEKRSTFREGEGRGREGTRRQISNETNSSTAGGLH